MPMSDDAKGNILALETRQEGLEKQVAHLADNMERLFTKIDIVANTVSGMASRETAVKGSVNLVNLITMCGTVGAGLLIIAAMMIKPDSIRIDQLFTNYTTMQNELNQSGGSIGAQLAIKDLNSQVVSNRDRIGRVEDAAAKRTEEEAAWWRDFQRQLLLKQGK